MRITKSTRINYGIYVAEYKLWKMQYVNFLPDEKYENINPMQTKTRWNNHRSLWNKFNVNDKNDRAAPLSIFKNFIWTSSMVVL